MQTKNNSKCNHNITTEIRSLSFYFIIIITDIFKTTSFPFAFSVNMRRTFFFYSSEQITSVIILCDPEFKGQFIYSYIYCSA